MTCGLKILNIKIIIIGSSIVVGILITDWNYATNCWLLLPSSFICVCMCVFFCFDWCYLNVSNGDGIEVLCASKRALEFYEYPTSEWLFLVYIPFLFQCLHVKNILMCMVFCRRRRCCCHRQRRHSNKKCNDKCRKIWQKEIALKKDCSMSTNDSRHGFKCMYMWVCMLALVAGRSLILSFCSYESNSMVQRAKN